MNTLYNVPFLTQKLQLTTKMYYDRKRWVAIEPCSLDLLAENTH